MDAIREFLVADSLTSLAIGGFIVGVAFGFVVYRTNFCTMGSISDIMSFGDYRRFRSWILAIAVAILGAQALHSAGAVDLGRSMYLSSGFNWLGHVIGGFLFGFGMVFAGGCASRNVARAGGGDIRSLIVLIVVGMFAYMTIGGIIGPVRAELQSATQIELTAMQIANQGANTLLARVLPMDAGVARWLVAGVLAGAFLVYAFMDKSFRASPVHIAAGVGIGLCVVAGWALTGLAYDEFAERAQAPVSLTYVRPAGDSMEYLMRFTAARIPSFGVSTVFGALAGAFIAALAMGRFKVTGFADTGDTLRNVFGAALMGIGGVMALGCTIGQGITGVSTLALGSLITLATIILGGIVGMKALERVLMG